MSNADEVDLSVYDYVVDCIDTVTAKMELIRRCHRMNIPIIVCMGAANKVDPSSFTVADITNTRICPLAKVLRKHLRREGITAFPLSDRWKSRCTSASSCASTADAFSSTRHWLG